MAAPLYFLPRVHAEAAYDGPKKFRRELVADRGLGHVLSDVRDRERECAVLDLTGAGPGGASGLIVVRLSPAAQGLPSRCGYYPEWQEWHEVGGHWLGLDREERPSPDDLSRPRVHPGYPVELGDGREWRVPIVRRPDGTSELPRSLGWDKGTYRERLKAEYVALWEDLAEVIAWCPDWSPPAECFPRAAALAVRVLALNYRLDEALLSVLELLDTANVWTVLMCAVDWPRYLRLTEAEKKTACPPMPEITSTSPGSAAAHPATERAAAS